MGKFHSIKADIPLPPEVYVLGELFSRHGASLFAVGGAIRDFLFSAHHGGDFSPKDVDLATEIPPEKVLNILSEPEAISAGIKTFPKGESFGVISAVINGEEYEIATFREDGQYSDGRHPDFVKFSTPAKDAQRRDLTFNALFYHIHKKEIRDYNLDQNGQGQGLQDIKNLVARPVGNPHDRFGEDKLRIPRLVRFFSRFNPGEILHHLDKETLSAIEKFKNLKGVSPERIATEFISGLKKSANPINYLKNYQAVGLLPAVFPNLNIDLQDVDQIGDVRNVNAVLAWLLKKDEPKSVRFQLNNLKYSNDISDTVAFLLRLFNFEINQIAQLLKHRDLYKQISVELQQQAKDELERNVLDFAKISGKEVEFKHFLGYQSSIKSQDYQHLNGKEIGDAMKNAEAKAYLESNGK